MPRQLPFSNRTLQRLSIALLSSFALIYGAIQFSSAANTTAAFPDPAQDIALAASSDSQTAVFAGGCFWGIEAVFEHLKGVSNAVTGYAGGSADSATYQQVSSGSTDHAESVQVTYDPAEISYGQLLKVYFAVAHDPTQRNRQDADVGSQYRSAIFFANEEQQQVAQAYIAQLNQAAVFDRPIVTQVTPLNSFYAAEAYHQNFIDRNPYHPYVLVHDLPKINRLQAQFPQLYRQ